MGRGIKNRGNKYYQAHQHCRYTQKCLGLCTINLITKKAEWLFDIVQYAVLRSYRVGLEN